LTLQGTVSPEHAPTFLAPDRTGKYLLSAYYRNRRAWCPIRQRPDVGISVSSH
jgi:hypothetical protein